MEIFNEKNEVFSTFSKGIEADYRGQSIVYKKGSIVIMYYYYPAYKRAYILQDDLNGIELPYIEGKIKVICYFENRRCTKLRKIFNSLEDTYGTKIYTLDELAILKVYALINDSKKTIHEVKAIINRESLRLRWIT